MIHQYMSSGVQKSHHLHFPDEQPIFISDSLYLCCISEEGQVAFLYYSFKCIFFFHRELALVLVICVISHIPYDIHFLSVHNFKVI